VSEDVAYETAADRDKYNIKGTQHRLKERFKIIEGYKFDSLYVLYLDNEKDWI
jgi:hypothetical protein